MVQISLRSRADMKIHLDTLIDLVETNRCMEACNTVDALKTDIVKHFSTRGMECNHILDVIMRMRWTLKHFTVDGWRKTKMYELFAMLVNALSSSEKDETLRGKLSRIYQDVVEDLNTICSTGDPKDIDTLSEDFLALQLMDKQISELHNPDIYKKYSNMMEDTGKCQATLNKLNPRKSGDMWTLNKDALGSLSNSFQVLYASIQKLIVSLSEPPESKDYAKKESSESFSDIEEDQLKAMRSEAYRLLTEENWRMSDIGPHMNMTTDEVKELLEIEDEEE